MLTCRIIETVLILFEEELSRFRELIDILEFVFYINIVA